MDPKERLSAFQLSEVEKKAYALLSPNRVRIDPDDFDRYDKAVIEQDKNRVVELERSYAEKNTREEKDLLKLAEIFEILFSQFVELENWLGEDVFITETSKFDDYVGGIDAIAEFLRKGSTTHLGLAIDVTFSNSVTRKIDRIKKEIDEGKMPQVRYFISQAGDYKGELNNIPRVVIGTDRKSIDQLAEFWLDWIHLKERKRKAMLSGQNTNQITSQIAEIKLRLENHPLQIEILAQTELQLERFGEYALRKNKPRIAAKYQSVLTIIRNIRRQKSKLEKQINQNGYQMRVFHEIDRELNSLLEPSAPVSDF